ncbi:hypothetical protein R0G64_31590, partial [Pseudomonas otitidis]|nr:hypothetical protein [Pseudomonas otitidis]
GYPPTTLSNATLVIIDVQEEYRSGVLALPGLDAALEDDEREHVQTLLKRRIHERVPAAYLLGEAWFCGLPF